MNKADVEDRIIQLNEEIKIALVEKAEIMQKIDIAVKEVGHWEYSMMKMKKQFDEKNERYQELLAEKERLLGILEK